MKTSGYVNTARALHWIMAALILLTVPAGLIMVQDDVGRDIKNVLFIYHKNVGVLLLILVLLRLAVRWRHSPPAKPSSLPVWQVRVADATHTLLYALLVIVPVAGFIRVRAGGFPIEALDALGVPLFVPRSDALAEQAKTVHYLAGLMIMACMALHISAALFHGIVKRDGVVARMWPPLGGGDKDSRQ